MIDTSVVVDGDGGVNGSFYGSEGPEGEPEVVEAGDGEGLQVTIRLELKVVPFVDEGAEAVEVCMEVGGRSVDWGLGHCAVGTIDMII